MSIPSKKAPAKSKPTYISYSNTLRILRERLNATPEEIAGWVWFGPEIDGLAAYADDEDPPKRFYLGENMDLRDPDATFCDINSPAFYLPPMEQAYFRITEIEDFEPKARFLTGSQLIARWQPYLGERLEAFIKAATDNGSLDEQCPIIGSTEWGKNAPKEIGLFELANIEAIELEEGITPVIDHAKQEEPLSSRRNNAILKELKAAGHDPLSLKVAKGKKGVKAEIRERVSTHGYQPWMSSVAFNKAWLELRQQGKIKDE